ncbi:MAG: hypothetical protein R3E95_23065 [Thiolinea sp.]
MPSAVCGWFLKFTRNWTTKTYCQKVHGIGQEHCVHAQLIHGQTDKNFLVYPVIGIPDAYNLYRVMNNSPDTTIAMIYDEVGLEPAHGTYICWLKQSKLSRFLAREHRIAFDLTKDEKLW